MSGALNVDTPHKLLKKLEHEIKALTADKNDGYAAINAVRDAYHLREWIWWDYLHGNVAMQTNVMGVAGGQEVWNAWVNREFPDFSTMRDICNGSKHLILNRQGPVADYHQAGWDNQPWDRLPWDSEGFYVELRDRQVISVHDLLTRVRDFWAGVFSSYSL